MVRHALRGALGVAAIAVTGFCALAGLLTMLPPVGGLIGWGLSVAFTEFSLLLILPAVVGGLLAWFARWAGLLRTGAAAALLAALAIVLSILPAIRGGIEVADADVTVDPFDYVSGFVGVSARAPDDTVEYAEVDGEQLVLDVWLPPDLDAAALRDASRSGEAAEQPALVYVHGGGWSGGGREESQRWNAWFAAAGYVVFDIDYRLSAADRPTWGLAPGDVKCAVSWVRTHGSEWGVDPDRVTLMGDSAGAHLAMLAAYAGPDLPSSCPEVAARTPGGSGEGGSGATDPDGPAPVSAVIALYPPTLLTNAYLDDRPWWYDPLLWDYRIRSLDWYLGGSPDRVPDAYTASEPFRHVTSDAPPTLLIHGSADRLVPPEHSRVMATELRRVGVPHHLVEIAYADHGFDLNFGGFASTIAKTEITDFTAEHSG